MRNLNSDMKALKVNSVKSVLDCELSLFFFRFSKGSARVRLQSRAWSFACLGHFARQTKKRETARSLNPFCQQVDDWLLLKITEKMIRENALNKRKNILIYSFDIYYVWAACGWISSR